MEIASKNRSYVKNQQTACIDYRVVLFTGVGKTPCVCRETPPVPTMEVRRTYVPKTHTAPLNLHYHHIIPKPPNNISGEAIHCQNKKIHGWKRLRK